MESKWKVAAVLGTACIVTAASAPQAGDPTGAARAAKAGPQWLSIDDITVEIVGCESETECQDYEENCFEKIYDHVLMGVPADPTDWPDGQISVFRRDNGTATEVQLIIPNSGWTYDLGFENGNYRMIGPDFDNLVFDSDPILDSDQDSSPCLSNDLEWVMSTWYDAEIDTVHAIVHNEYRGNFHNANDFWPPQPICGDCSNSRTCCLLNLARACPPGDIACHTLHCNWTTLTQGTSTDGGASYTQNQNPEPALLASAPYKYRPDLQDMSPYLGMFAPSNIMRSPRDGYYYMVSGLHLPAKFESSYGHIWGRTEQAVLLRTDDPSDPSSWRGWEGPPPGQTHGCDPTGGMPTPDTGSGAGTAGMGRRDPFTVRLWDPYPAEPSDHSDFTPMPLDPFWFLCQEPTVAQFHSNLVWSDYLNAFLLLGEAPAFDAQMNLIRASFFSVSRDLVNWEPAKQIHECVTAPEWNAPMWPVLVDHDSRSDNFDIVGQEAHVYFRRVDPTNTGYDIWRTPLRFVVTTD